MSSKVKIGIVGAAGWVGIELIKILLNHPNASIKVITSRDLYGKTLSGVFANFNTQAAQKILFTKPNTKELLTCDLVFFATPHGVAMNMAGELLKGGVRIIDLGADFRIKDSVLWQKYYNMEHTKPQLLTQAVYGLTEHNRQTIKSANLIANPGCYPTVVSLALKPLLNANYINKQTIIADCKSGVSGAGRGANLATSFCEVNETTKAYGVSGHRHLPEITQTLSDIADDDVKIVFIPHLIPMARGMLATIYVDLIADKNIADIRKLFINCYQNEPFVQVLADGQIPETRFVKYSNNCQIGIQLLDNKKLLILATIDNLVKGASGQAVQNMNIMFDLPETQGLADIGVIP